MTNGGIQEIETGLNSQSIKDKRVAIRKAKDLMERGLSRAEIVTLLLEVLARNDEFATVKDDVRALLEAEALRNASPPGSEDETHHTFGLRCPKCQHITYFDKRRECGPSGILMRQDLRAGKCLDVLQLACEACGYKMEGEIDCEGYR